MMKYGHHPRQISCTPLTILFMVIFTPRKGTLNRKILLHVFLFMLSASTVYCAACLRADGDHTSYRNIYDIRF